MQQLIQQKIFHALRPKFLRINSLNWEIKIKIKKNRLSPHTSLSHTKKFYKIHQNFFLKSGKIHQNLGTNQIG